MQLVAKLGGGLTEYLKGRRDKLAVEVTAGVNQTSIELRDDLRNQVRSKFRAGRKSRDFTKTVRALLFPKRRPSTSAAGLVSFTASWMRAHVEGVTIRAAGGRWLVIPLPAAERLGFDKQSENRTSFGRFAAGSKAGDANIRKAEAKFGPLAPMRAGGGRVLLLANPPSPPKRRRRGTPTKHADGRIPLFLLTPAVSLRKRLDIEGPSRRALDRLAVRTQSAIDKGLLG